MMCILFVAREKKSPIIKEKRRLGKSPAFQFYVGDWLSDLQLNPANPDNERGGSRYLRGGRIDVERNLVM